MSNATTNNTAAPETPSTEIAAPVPAESKSSLVIRFADRYGVQPEKLLSTLMLTCFKPKGEGKALTVAQMMSLLVVADQYKLNPFTREIYAFPQDGGIVPIVGVDGWIRIMNEQPTYDGIKFEYGPEIGEGPVKVNEWVECSIFRKDLSKPITVREYIVECRRNSGPWNQSPRRMLRHRALMQCARVAFGFAGIYDEDEAEQILQAESRQPDAPAAPPSGRVNYRNKQQPAAPAADAPAAAPAADEIPDAVFEHHGPAGLTPEQELQRQEIIEHVEAELANEDISFKTLRAVGDLLAKNARILGDEEANRLQKLFNARKAGSEDPAFMTAAPAAEPAPAAARRKRSF